MTSEVVIINAQGIALATDSAVTIGSQKIYNSAIKLFALSKSSPVGVMIYGRADLMNVPWELIIKCYRRSLGKKKFDHLHQYADDFIEFIKKCDYFSENEQKRWISDCTDSYYSLIREELFSLMHEHVKKNGSITSKDTKSILSSLINKHHKELESHDYSLGFGSESIEKINDLTVDIAKSKISEIFEKLPLTNTQHKKLIAISSFLFFRNVHHNSDISGIVITGYGEKEIFPNVITYEITGFIAGHLKYSISDEKTYNNNTNGISAIIPFADSNMIHMFMQGISPSITEFLGNYLEKLFELLPKVVDKSLATSNSHKNKKLTNALSKSLQMFFDSMTYHQKIEHSDTVMKMVGALPKDELAAMAESLINLTAFKRRVSHTIESVGGPIDVAVISKGDGLVWVKRKHYFPPELNPSFIRNYMDDCK